MHNLHVAAFFLLRFRRASSLRFVEHFCGGDVLPIVNLIMTYDANTTDLARRCADCPFESGSYASIREATGPDDLTLPLYEASFGQAVRRFFKSYAKFSGRASRSEYWWSILFIVGLVWTPMVLFLLGGLLGSLSTGPGSGDDPDRAAELTATGTSLTVFGGILMVIAFFGTIVPLLAISWRRLHDGNFPGPVYFLKFVPWVGIVVDVLMLMPPRPEGQRFDVCSSARCHSSDVLPHVRKA